MNLEDFKVMKDRYDAIVLEYKKNIGEFGKDLFSQIAKNIFEKNLNLNSFGWTQYTPYFNDGDVCTFGVNYEWSLYINDNDVVLDIYDKERWLEQGYSYAPDFANYGFTTMQELVSAVEDVHNVLDLFSENDLKMIFGDHAQIMVYVDGQISVEHYNHD